MITNLQQEPDPPQNLRRAFSLHTCPLFKVTASHFSFLLKSIFPLPPSLVTIYSENRSNSMATPHFPTSRPSASCHPPPSLFRYVPSSSSGPASPRGPVQHFCGPLRIPQSHPSYQPKCLLPFKAKRVLKSFLPHCSVRSQSPRCTENSPCPGPCDL